MTWVIVASLLAAAVLLGIDAQTRVALYVAPVWFALLAIGYARVSRHAASAGQPAG